MRRLLLYSFSHFIPLLVALSAPFLLSVPAVAIPFDAIVSAVTVDPQDSDRIYASTAGVLLRSDNRGATWQQFPIFPLGSRQPFLRRIEFDLTNTATIYGTAPGDVSEPLVGAWRSVNRGANWQRIIQSDTFPAGSQLVRLLVAPTDGSVLYAVVKRGDAERTYRSGDAGASWVQGGVGGAHAVSTGDPNTLYHGRSGRVYRSTNGGQGWSQIGQTYDADDTVNVINDIAVSPSNPNILLATMSGPNSTLNGIFRSTNGGSGWTQVRVTNAVEVYFNPSNGADVIVGGCCSLSTYYSSDGGLTFVLLAEDLAGFPDNLSPSVGRTWFGHEQARQLIAGVRSAQGGGLAVASAPNGLWNKLPGEYTPTAVPSTFLDSGKLLSGDTSTTQTTVDIVAAEGSSAPGFTIGTPIDLKAGIFVEILEDGTNPEDPTPSFVVTRSAEKLAPGMHQAQLSIPVTGALNAQVHVDGVLEVADAPEAPGVYLGTAIDDYLSVFSLASSAGKLYIGGFARIYSLDDAGNLEILAGAGSSGFSGDGGLATQAKVSLVNAIAAAPDGSVYFHDSSNRRIRRIAPNGKISTFAGDPSGSTTITDGAALGDVSFSSTPGLAFRPNGELHLAHSSRIWRVEGNKFLLVAGGGIGAPNQGANADDVSLSGVRDIATDSQGRIVFSSGRQMFRIEANGKLAHLAGAQFGHGVFGSQNAKETEISIGSFTLRNDRIFLTDRTSETIMRVDPNGDIATVAFNGMSGTPSSCTGALYAPIDSSLVDDIAFGPDGSLFVGDTRLPRFWLPPAGGPAGPAPVVTAEGVVNAASFSRQISPGTLASVFGSNVSASGAGAAASSLPLPAQLNGTVICLAGELSPLIYAGPLQANGQFPFGLEPGMHSLRVFNVNGGSGSVPVELQATSPGVFRANGRAVVINPDGSLNVPGNGVSSGAAVVVYLTGIGDVTPELIAGWANPGAPDPLAVPNGATSATVGGVTAELYYLGMTPDFAGLAQANIKIPALPPGEYLFVLTVGGHSSEPLLLTIK